MMIFLVDVVFGYCSLAIALIAGIYLYMLLISRILPLVLLKPIVGGTLAERGVKKSVFPGGRSIAYEPKLSTRKYINQYVLFSENGFKYIKCRVNEKVTSLKYELVIYDRKNKAIDRLEITQGARDGCTDAVMLPPETSFVHLNLCEFNGTPIKEKDPELYSGAGVFWFFAIVLVLNFALGLVMNYIVVEVSDVLLGYFQCVKSVDPIPPLAVIACVSIFSAAAAVLFNIARPCKFVWKNEKTAANDSMRFKEMGR